MINIISSLLGLTKKADSCAAQMQHKPSYTGGGRPYRKAVVDPIDYGCIAKTTIGGLGGAYKAAGKIQDARDGLVAVKEKAKEKHTVVSKTTKTIAYTKMLFGVAELIGHGIMSAVAIKNSCSRQQRLRITHEPL